MANTFGSVQVVLDTFTSAIDVASSLGFPAGAQLKVESIEWQTPTTIDHTALITNNKGDTVFSEKCTLANKSIIKYFHGTWIDNLKIAISGVGSGAIVITLC